jgi:hypothetical protein
LLSRKYHEPFAAIADLRRSDPARFEREVMTPEVLGEHGRFLRDTNDAVLDAQFIPGTNPPVIVQFSLLGVPMARFDDVFTAEVIANFTALGVYCKKQPNSVVIAPKGVDKATCVSWLLEHEPHFSLERAIAFGDVPATIDRPLSEFPPMPFVSVSPDPAADPPGVVHVGGEERGTAQFLQLLVDASSQSPNFSIEFVRALAAKACDALR